MNTLSERLAELSGKATVGPWDIGPCNLVRALRGDLAVPLFEPRDAYDPLPAPTVRDGSGKVQFRANSDGAKMSRAFRQEKANAALIIELVNAYRAGRLIVKDEAHD